MKGKIIHRFRKLTTITDTFAQNEQEYEKVHFRGHSYTPRGITSVIFDHCLFTRCDFSEAEIKKCRFEHCLFIDCNLNVTKLTDSQFEQTVFISCRLSGIDWSLCNTKIGFTIRCLRCDLSYGVFDKMDISENKFSRCKCHEVAFNEVKARKCNFRHSDFTRAQFQKSLLIGADFRHAKNYILNPFENICKDAKFHYPEVLGLLRPFEVQVCD